MDKNLAIRTIEEVYNQIAVTAFGEDEDLEKEFWDIFNKHHPSNFANAEDLFPALKRLGVKKLVAIATELGPLFSAESMVYDMQAEYICNEFGQKAMEKANYGNGVDEGLVSTKVYGIGVLQTRFNQNATNPDEINEEHDFEYFSKDEEE